MGNWEQKNFFEAIGKAIFSDKIGYGILPLANSFTFQFIGSDKPYNSDEVYVLSNGSYVRVDCLLADIVAHLYELPLYINKSFINNQFELLDLQGIKFSVDIPVLKDYTELAQKSSTWKKIHIEKSLTGKEEFDNFTLWVFDANIKKAFKLPYCNVKIGEEYYYIGKGKCKVVTAYDYPSRETEVCEVEFADGSVMQISNGDYNFVGLPAMYDIMTAGDDLRIFNEQLNEKLLMPYVEPNENSYVVFWRPIDNATIYTVEVYRVIKGKFGRQLYHLVDYSAENGKNYMIIPNEGLGKPVIFRMVAKDKDGNIVAYGRGMEKGYPRFYD